MPKPKKIQYNGDSKIVKALSSGVNWLLDNMAISNLVDVNLEELSNGQVLKYDSLTETWVNRDESGGGGGGGSAYSIEDIYTGTERVVSMQMLKSIDNFDAVEIEITYPYFVEKCQYSSMISVYRILESNANRKCLIGSIANRYCELTFTDNSTLYLISCPDQEQYVSKVRGIKFGGGGSKYSETVLFTGTGSESTYALSETIQNFDMIEVQIRYSPSGNYRVPTLFPVSDFETGVTYRATADDWYVGFAYTDDTTFTKIDSRNAYITHIKGIKCGGGSGGGNSGIFSKSVIQSQNILSEFEYKNVSIPSYAENVSMYPFSEHYIGSDSIPTTDVENDNTSLTIYAVAKCTVNNGDYHSLIACSYASSNGNAPNIYSRYGILYTSVYGTDTSTSVNSMVYHVLSLVVDATTKKARYYIDGVAYHGEKSINNCGRFPSFGGTITSTTMALTAAKCDLIYGAVVLGAESAEDIIANHNLLMQEYAEYIGH